MNITPTPNVCGNCGVEERLLLLLHVRHRGIFRRLCTSCVLKLHPRSFCPICFLVYDRFPTTSSNDIISCLKCDSFSHSHCVRGSNSINPYTCPPCADHNALVFDVSCREIDKKAAKVLLAAVRVAAASISKAAVGARAEAEKRAKEADFAKKRAREALEHVAFLVSRGKLKRKESFLSAEVSFAKERNHKAGLKAKERLPEFGGQIAVLGSQNNGAVMDVWNNERLRVTPASNVGAPFTQNNENERSGNLNHLENYNAQGEKVTNGLYSVSPVGYQLKHMQNNHGREENIGY